MNNSRKAFYTALAFSTLLNGCSANGGDMRSTEKNLYNNNGITIEQFTLENYTGGSFSTVNVEGDDFSCKVSGDLVAEYKENIDALPVKYISDANNYDQQAAWARYKPDAIKNLAEDPAKSCRGKLEKELESNEDFRNFF